MIYLKKTIPVCLVVVHCLILVNCGSNQNKTDVTTNTPFRIINGSFQEWVAGVQGGGAGVNLEINCNEIKEGVVFQKLYFRNTISEVKLATPNKILGYFTSHKNRDIIMDGNTVNEAVNTPPEPFPFTLKPNEAVLSYTYNGKMQYTKIDSLIEKEALAYPASPPNNNN